MTSVLRAIEASDLVFSRSDSPEGDDHHDEREPEEQQDESERTGNAARSRSRSTRDGHVTR